MAWVEVEGWQAHGRVWKGKNGRLSFYIRGDGKEVRTGASTLQGALAALERYERTGNAIQADSGPVRLDEALAKDFLAASKDKGNSLGWRRNQRQHLAWWAQVLGNKDLRAGRQGSVTPANLREALSDAPSRAQRERVLRALYSFLRGEDRIATAEDPTYGKPHIVPAGRPAQDTMDKSISKEALDAVRGYLEADFLRSGRKGRRWADLLAVLDGTGMHVTELYRLAEAGRVEPLPAGRAKGRDESAVLVVPAHKNGAPYRVAVSEATAQAATRVRASGPFSVAVFYGVLRKAKEVTGFEVKPGRFRHTVAKLAVEQGATVEQVGGFLGHKSMATTKKFYTTHGLPANVPTRS